MSREVTVALCGANGFGQYYVKALLAHAGAHQIRFIAAVNRSEPQMRPELEAAGVQIFTSLQEMFGAGLQPDFVILSTGITCHREQTEYCFSQGSHVLCEKPVAASLEDAEAMQSAAEKSGLILSIGYQWSFTSAIQELKRRVLAGEFGRPLCLKTLVHWPRPDTYYSRNNWAGAIEDEQGAPVLDSPVMNATAHYLHNALYILGDTVETSAGVHAVEAELFRTYPIENYDTTALRIKTDGGVTVLFYTTHAALKCVGPMFSYRFEKATVYFSDYNSHEQIPGGARFNTGIIVRYEDGRVDNLGDPEADLENKIWQMADAIRTGGSSLCSAAAAMPHLHAVLEAQRFPVKTFSDDRIIQVCNSDGSVQRWVPGLENSFLSCFTQEVLPSELAPAF